MKSRINISGLSIEETYDLKDAGNGKNKHTQEVHNTARTFLKH